MDSQPAMLWPAGLLSTAGPLVLAAQIACLVHVVKTGRPYWWLWLIFGIPGAGLIAYLLLEVRPSLGRVDWHSVLWSLKSSRERIALREQRLEESTTVKNRLALADELHAAGQFDRECEVLEAGLRGAFKDDAQLWTRLAEAHLEAGRTAEAEAALARSSATAPADVQFQQALLRARLLGQTGHTAEAERRFQELMARKKSEAPRYYYAEFLLAQGHDGQARALLNDILLQYRRGTPVWRHLERRWFNAARQLLRQRGAR